MKNKITFGSLILLVLTVTGIIWINTGVQSQMDFYLKMSNDELNQLPKYDRPDLADLHNFEMTKDPSLGYPPSERIFKAYDETKRMISTRREIKDTWVERGPNNFGGRSRAIFFDPNDPFSHKVWSAGVAGGLWYNEDITSAYSEWQPVNDFFGNIAISAMAFDPIATKVMYFGTGEGWGNADAVRGNGIWKSEDGGETWDQLASTTDERFYYVQKLAVTNQSTLLAATRHSAGILRSEDGGETWEEVVSESRGADIEIAGDIIYASTGVGIVGSMWKSTDDGKTWVEITPADGLNRMEIGVHPNHPNTVYVVAAQGGDIGGFYKSENAGASWSNVAIPKYYEQGGCEQGDQDFARGQAWYDLIIAVNPVNKNELIVGGIDLYKSETGGKSWGLISYWTGECDNYVHADQHNFIFRPGYPNEGFATTDGGVYYTKDFFTPLSEGGPSFEARNHGFNIAQYYSCAMANEIGSDYFLAGAQDNGSHQFFNPGINSVNEITGGDGAFCFIDQDNPNFQITSYVYNSYNITLNNWESFDVVRAGSSVGRFINPADYNSNTNTMFAAGNEDQIVRYVLTEDTDIESEVLDIDINEERISALAHSKYDDDVMFVGTGNGSIYKLTEINGAIGAELISTDVIEEDIYISSIAVGTDIDHLLITASNYGVTSVYESTDGGANWVTKEGNLPDMPVRWALFNPNDYSEVLLATELGVWMTNDISSEDVSWNPLNSGLANVRCDMLKYREADGLVAVATHGRGLFTSDIFATTEYSNFISPSVAYQGQEIQFTNASMRASSFSWDFGDANMSQDSNPLHTFDQPGTYDIKLTINGDEALAKVKQLQILPYREVTYGLTDGGDFETNLEDFYPVTINGTGFELGKSEVRDKDGTNSGDNAWVTGLDDETYEAFTEAYLYTPIFNFIKSGAYEISFATKYRIEDEWEGFTLEYSLDFGRSWFKLESNVETDQWYNQTALSEAVAWTPGESFFSGKTDGFEIKNVTFDILSNNEAVAFRFVFKSDPGTEFAGIAIDDFVISAPDISTEEVLFESTSSTICEGEIITLVNKSQGNIDTYLWEFGSGAVPSTATGFGPHKVIFMKSGSVEVKLTGYAGNDVLVYSDNFEINTLATDIEVDQDNFSACAQDDITVNIASSEDGTNYSMIDVITTDTVAQGTGNGSSLAMTALSLQPGLHEYRIIGERNGCFIQLSPFITARVKENPAVVIIDLGGGKITVSPGDAYQWYLDGVAIEGATTKDYSPTQSGVYTAHVSFGDCISISDEYILGVLSSEVSDNRLSIYPNPANTYFEIKSSNLGDIQFVEVFDNRGAFVTSKTSIDSDHFQMKCESWERGVYFVKTHLKDGSFKTQRIILK